MRAADIFYELKTSKKLTDTYKPEVKVLTHGMDIHSMV